MNKIDWKRKLTSRKLWLSAAGFAAGLVIAFGGSKSTSETVSGCIMSGAAVIAYTVGEGLTDAAHSNSIESEEKFPAIGFTIDNEEEE